MFTIQISPGFLDIFSENILLYKKAIDNQRNLSKLGALKTKTFQRYKKACLVINSSTVLPRLVHQRTINLTSFSGGVLTERA